MRRPRCIFLTGATGLLGSYLLKLLLKDGHRVYALARNKDNKPARERIKEVLRFWDRSILVNRKNNLTVLEGDITEKNLGLDRKTIKLLENRVEELFHCAALTSFNPPLREIRKVNVKGTENILKLAKRFSLRGRIKKVNHISTAYVCGDYKGVFKEDDLDKAQGFGTTYERSKFEAEKLIERYRKRGLWIDIYRPCLIIGESKTGKIFNPIILYQTIHLWSLKIFDVFPGKNILFNVVPVDLLSQAILTISYHNLSRNKTYHPFPQKRVPMREFLRAFGQGTGLKRPKLITSKEFKKTKLTSVQRKILENNIFYFNPQAILDSRKTNRTLRNYGFRFPEIDKNILLSMIKYLLRIRFIKK